MQRSFLFSRMYVGATLASMMCASAVCQTAPSLEQGFLDPPQSAKPRVWWHWMNGNITKEGIALDLDWMHRIGLGGFQNFDAALNTPQVVDKRLVYMTPEWKDAFLFATRKADSLGLEMAVAGSPGWSESGGPWVKPSQAMKKLVWSEVSLEGGKPFHGVLPKAPYQTGPFQDLAQQDLMGLMGSGDAPKVGDFSAEVAVIAYRNPAEAVSMKELAPKVTLNDGSSPNADVLWDGDMNESLAVPLAGAGKSAWIQFDFGSAMSFQSVTLAMGGPRDPLALFGSETNDGPLLESSNDGTSFTQVVRMPTFGAAQHTMTFAPITARYFRMSFHEQPHPSLADSLDMGIPAFTETAHHVAELVLHREAYVNRFEEKAGYAPISDLYGFATPKVGAGSVIARTDVVDLTAKVAADGTLDWTPPPGRWTVLRMGYSLTGITNHPAPPEATGPEVDKLNRADVKEYIEHYLDNYKDATGGLMGKRGLQYVITDSWEASTQNWTDAMVAEFTKRRGYDPRPWLPVVAGRIVGSAEDSDRFLWDLRKTIADLLAENHYGTIAEALHARGMGQYGESHEAGRATIGDGMEMKRADDVPMAAMWTQQPGVNSEQYGYNADIRESASVAHIYGRNLVAAESLTAATNPWAWSPATLKPTADKELAMGLNRFVIHSSVHQPLIGKAPGLALGPFGQWFNRNEVWAEQAQPWITYLARNSYMLQQGQFVADIAYFYGEDSNVTAIFAAKSPDVPSGYNFDFVNADILTHNLQFRDGQLRAPSGMSYRVLVLDPYSSHMSLPVLRRLRELVKEGATVIGEKPVGTPSLTDDAAAFQQITAELWNGNGVYGKGRVLHGRSMSEALQAAGLRPDTSFSKPEADTSILFVHRRVADGEIYYADNRNDRAEKVTAGFRVTGKTPELWHADTGKMEPVSYTIADGVTSVPLTFDPFGTVFVVFRKPAASASVTLPQMAENTVATLNGPWTVRFEEGKGAPAEVGFPELGSWTDNKDAGVRYFSGHATYRRTVEASGDWFHPGAEVWLDLGEVKNIAEVKVNGQSLGIVWKAPFRVDIGRALKPGTNQLEVTVANLWVNRLIGDLQPDATAKYTFTAHNPYKANSPLLPAGLLGPVRIVRREESK